MTAFRTASACAAIVVACGTAFLVAAQPGDAKKPSPPAAQPDMQKKMLEDWVAKSQPGAEHARLKQFEGAWDAAVKMWGGSETPEESTGSMVNSLIFEGRFIQHDYTGTFMDKPFKGTGHFGYNNLEQRWEHTWLDSVSTGIMLSTGSFDEKTGEWTLTGEYKEADGSVCKAREVLKVISKDKHVLTMYQTMGNRPEAKMMEITYTRRAGGARPTR